MRYLWLTVLFMVVLVGCGDINRFQEKLDLKVDEESKEKNEDSFKGPAPMFNYSPTYTTTTNADGAESVGAVDQQGQDASHFKEIMKSLTAAKIDAINARDTAIDATREAEKERDIALQRSVDQSSSSGFYYMLIAGAFGIFVIFFSILLLVLKYQLGVRTKAFGNLVNKGTKFATRHKMGMKSIGEHIREAENTIARNGITKEEKARVEQHKNNLRDLRDTLLGRLLYEDDELAK